MEVEYGIKTSEQFVQSPHLMTLRHNKNFCNKVRKKAKIRNQYNQDLHLAQDTT